MPEYSSLLFTALSQAAGYACARYRQSVIFMLIGPLYQRENRILKEGEKKRKS